MPANGVETGKKQKTMTSSSAAEPKSTSPPRSLRDLLPGYDALFVDMWGTLYDREVGLYPRAAAALLESRRQGKRVVLTSNAARPAAREVAVQLGETLTADHYDGVLTAGEVLREALMRESGQAGRYMMLGHARNAGLLLDLGYEETAQLEEAEFLVFAGLAAGDLAFQVEDRAFRETWALLERALERGLPLYVCKTDWITFFPDGRAWLGPGPLAAWYRAKGGDCRPVGKPSRAYYQEAERLFGLSGKRVLAIGDQLTTDIQGAAEMGYDSLWITGNAAQQAQGTEIMAQLARHMGLPPLETGILPTLVMEVLR